MAEKGVELDTVDLNKGLSVKQLDEIIGERDHKPFLNSRNALFREMGMKDNPPPRKKALKLMSENPNLIKRPLTIAGDEIVLGFDQEALRGLAE